MAARAGPRVFDGVLDEGVRRRAPPRLALTLTLALALTLTLTLTLT